MPWTVCKWKGKILKFVKCSRRPHENGCEMYKNSKKKKGTCKAWKSTVLQNFSARGIRPENLKSNHSVYMKLQRRCRIFRSFQMHSTFPVTAWTHWRHRRPRARSVELFQPLRELTDVLARDQLLKQGQFFSYFILFLWRQTAIVTACARRTSGRFKTWT